MRLYLLSEGFNPIDNPSMCVMISSGPGMNDMAQFLLIDKRRPQFYLGNILVKRVYNVALEFINNDDKDTFFTAHCNAMQGFGPFLYDLAIEWATQKGKGLIPATGAKDGKNSINSDKVWQFYYEKRADVSKEHFGREGRKPWLFTIYRKDPVLLNRLEKEGRILSPNDKCEMGTYGFDPSKKMRNISTGKPESLK